MSTDSRTRLRAGLALVAVAAFATPVLAWGHTGHAMINKLACDCVPEGPLKTFFKANQDYVSKHAIDPDIYKRKHRAEEAPKHFLNIDAQGTKPEDYPRDWKAVVDKFGLHAATKQGKLPWAIKETFDKLVAAFKAKDGPRIIETATWLGHYVGDANQPFHACTNHDGADTGQKGIHSLFESAMIDHNEDEVAKASAALASKVQVAEVADVSSYAWTTILASDQKAHDILSKDKGNRTSGREKALFKATGTVAEERIADAATGLASLWFTAWVKAGSPELPTGFKLPEGVAPEPGHTDEE